MTRLAEIKRQVEDGTYKVDPALVAEAMLDRAAKYNGVDYDLCCEVRALDYEGKRQTAIAAETGFPVGTVARILRQHDRSAAARGRRLAA